MSQTNERGALNALLIPFILITIFFIAAASFGVWAFMGRQDYKNNVDPKIAAAVEVAKDQTASEKDKEFVEKEKLPFRTYNGPSSYGSISLQYPKTWSGYVSAGGNSAEPVDATFHPGLVTASDGKGAYALRLQVVSESYDSVLQSFTGGEDGTLTSQAYALPKVPKQVGIRVKGQTPQNDNVDLVALPLRDKTLLVWTEGNDFRNDFEASILPNITFSP